MRRLIRTGAVEGNPAASPDGDERWIRTASASLEEKPKSLSLHTNLHIDTSGGRGFDDRGASRAARPAVHAADASRPHARRSTSQQQVQHQQPHAHAHAHNSQRKSQQHGHAVPAHRTLQHGELNPSALIALVALNERGGPSTRDVAPSREAARPRRLSSGSQSSNKGRRRSKSRSMHRDAHASLVDEPSAVPFSVGVVDYNTGDEARLGTKQLQPPSSWETEPTDRRLATHASTQQSPSQSRSPSPSPSPSPSLSPSPSASPSRVSVVLPPPMSPASAALAQVTGDRVGVSLRPTSSTSGSGAGSGGGAASTSASMGKPSSFSINGVALTEIAQAAAQTCSEELLSPTRLQQRSAAQAMRSPAHATQAAVAKTASPADMDSLQRQVDAVADEALTQVLRLPAEKPPVPPSSPRGTGPPSPPRHSAASAGVPKVTLSAPVSVLDEASNGNSVVLPYKIALDAANHTIEQMLEENAELRAEQKKSREAVMRAEEKLQGVDNLLHRCRDMKESVSNAERVTKAALERMKQVDEENQSLRSANAELQAQLSAAALAAQSQQSTSSQAQPRSAGADVRSPKAGKSSSPSVVSSELSRLRKREEELLSELDVLRKQRRDQDAQFATATEAVMRQVSVKLSGLELANMQLQAEVQMLRATVQSLAEEKREVEVRLLQSTLEPRTGSSLLSGSISPSSGRRSSVWSVHGPSMAAALLESAADASSSDSDTDSPVKLPRSPRRPSPSPRLQREPVLVTSGEVMVNARD